MRNPASNPAHDDGDVWKMRQQKAGPYRGKIVPHTGLSNDDVMHSAERTGELGPPVSTTCAWAGQINPGRVIEDCTHCGGFEGQCRNDPNCRMFHAQNHTGGPLGITILFQIVCPSPQEVYCPTSCMHIPNLLWLFWHPT